MKKKILSYILCVILTISFSMVGCGKKAEQPVEAETAFINEESSVATADSEVIMEENASADNTLQEDAVIQEEISEEIDPISVHIQTLAEYQESEDYIGGIRYYDEEIGFNSDPELKEIRNSMVNEYIRQEVKIADELLSGSDSTAAIEEIEKAKEMLSDDSRWDSIIEYYQTVASQSLALMNPYFTKGKGSHISIGKDTTFANIVPCDQFGTEYGTAIQFKDGLLEGYNTLSMKYNLDRKYTTLTAITSENKSYTTTTDPKWETYLAIYCDEELVYKSPMVDDEMRPQDVSIDVTGVLDLRIDYIGDHEVLLNDPILYPENLGEPLYEHLEEVIDI